MRLSVQGCLILWLCLFALIVPSTASADLTSGNEKYVQNCKGSSYDYGDPVATWVAGMEANGYVKAWVSEGMNSSGNCWTGTGGVCPASHPYYTGDKNGNGSPICASENQCEAPYVMIETEPGSGVFYCGLPPQEPEACHENGEIYDPQTEQCVTECEHGMFNGSCLLPPEDNSECNSDSPDYRGEIVLGYGQSPVPACGDFDQCSGDTPGQVGMVNGELRCIPEDYGVPQCQGDTITVIDEYGFICEPLENQPEEEPDAPEEPNTDTDGDGEPDEYQRENDPESVDKGLDKINEGVGETNNKLDGMNDLLDKIGKGIAKSNELQDEANGVADESRDTLKEINDKLDAPEDGFNTEGLLGIPTMTETANSFKTAVLGNELIQSVGGLTEIPSHTSCPVWTIPATDYWEAKPMNVHCDILEEYRGTFSVIFMFFWTGIAIYAFLRA